MNSLANSILSFLLSWIRMLIYHIWAVLTSEDGGALYQFLAAHWLTMLVVLCVGGFLIDRIIYLIRWRPHYVWLSRLDRLRRKRRPEPVYEEWPQEAETAPAQDEPQPEAATLIYAPVQPSPYARPAQPVQPLEDAMVEWDEEIEEEWDLPQQEPAFGAARPEPAAYFRDVQAGFAPPIPPEELYARPAQPQPANDPVHPGLDEESFRQNFGLEEAPPAAEPVVHAPAFRPFTAVREDEFDTPRPRHPLSRLAKKARDWVGMNEEEAPTIRDLQSTVDVSKAFHEPVYPQSMNHNDDR